MRIASNLSTLTQFLPANLEAFLKKLPLIHVHLEEKGSTAAVGAVQENACDIGLIVEGPNTDGLEVIPYRSDRLVLQPDQPADPAGRGRVRHGLALPHAEHTYDALAAMVQAGLGIGMLPLKMAQLYAKAMNVRVVELDEPWGPRTHAIVIRSYNALQAAGKRLVDHLKRASRNPPETPIMSEHVCKTLELTGSSDKGIQEAVQRAVGKAHETIRNICWFRVTETRGHVPDRQGRFMAGDAEDRLHARRPGGSGSAAEAPK